MQESALRGPRGAIYSGETVDYIGAKRDYSGANRNSKGANPDDSGEDANYLRTKRGSAVRVDSPGAG